MRDILYTSTFKKDLKKVQKYSEFKSDKLKSFVNKLANGEALPESAKNHKMASNSHFKGLFNFHVAPDIAVLYRIDETSISLFRIGKHNNIGLTENL
jgi:addiction module RelE/StbE family toxin